MSRNSQDFDVLIVGGGVAGAATAIAVAKSRRRVAILHRQDDRAGIETISPQAAELLDDYSLQLGVPLEGITAWWGEAAPTRRYYPGSRIISRQLLASALRERASTLNAVQFQVLRQLQITKRADGWLVDFIDTDGASRAVRAQYAIDASGTASILGKRAGSHRKFSDELCAATATLQSPGLTGSWTESTESGWWNLCCLKEIGTLSFFGHGKDVMRVRENFLERFQETTHLQRMVHPRVSQIRVSPCASSALHPCADEGWLAVGDAAFNIHPLASAGVARALRDAQLAPQALRYTPTKYELFQRKEYDRYLAQLKLQYSSERRWAQSPFWRAMHGASNEEPVTKGAINVIHDLRK